ncbi:uncharacterized protein LTR77_010712 [Saxophila tyrrhenica]|uniref:HMG box domain-containing protein n=1 Tax=Saxophila tyrrhenica TaxID=1690608 RepID=A0AAV9NV21_9PEZI|nr:hypothetical protein LTR77_010712 [Saxophila tyrrhenica]
MASQAEPYQLDYQDLIASSVTDVVDQFGNGIDIPSVQFTSISTAKVEGLELYKHLLETDTGMKLQLTVNALENEVSIVPIQRMANTNVAAGGVDEGPKSPPKDKIPRPANAFILYRKDWHPVIPGLHNNDISVIIGRQWKEESEGIKELYKRKSEEAKRQHAIDHPGYQYQPRKPSEKKKRMTKTKLAKLRAQANDANAPQPTSDFDNMLANITQEQQISVDAFNIPGQRALPTLQQSGDLNMHLAIDANREQETSIREEIEAWNATGPERGAYHTATSLAAGQMLVNGIATGGIPQDEIPYDFTMADLELFPATEATPFQMVHYPTAEVNRQMAIWDDAIADLFFDFAKAQATASQAEETRTEADETYTEAQDA